MVNLIAAATLTVSIAVAVAAVLIGIARAVPPDTQGVAASMRRSSGLGPAYSSSHSCSSSNSSCVSVPIARSISSTFFPFMSRTRSLP